MGSLQLDRLPNDDQSPFLSVTNVQNRTAGESDYLSAIEHPNTPPQDGAGLIGLKLEGSVHDDGAIDGVIIFFQAITERYSEDSDALFVILPARFILKILEWMAHLRPNLFFQLH